MKSVKIGVSVSDSKTVAGCVSMCGMCPCCAFAAKPPGSIRCLWKVSDEFKRRFLMDLLLRCRNIEILESIQRVLSVTSWTLFTYIRSPTSPQHPDRAPTGKPFGLDLKKIWDWFNSSTEWLKLRYLCRLLSFCDSEMLCMAANLTRVLLVRQKRGFLQFNGKKIQQEDQYLAVKLFMSLLSSNFNVIQNNEDGDSEDPALMVVPGSLKSVSGVSRYRDFISCLHVNLSKRILGLLDEHTLRLCQKVCRYWQHLTHETLEEMKLSRKFQDKTKAMMQSKAMDKVSPTYAKIVEVPVPVREDEGDIPPSKVKLFEAAYAPIKTKTVQMEERNVYCGAYFTTVLVDKADPSRVLDYRGGSFMAVGSKDRVVNLLYVTSRAKSVSVLRGHVGSIRVVRLCEERDLLISASYDSSIRCWNLKTDSCVMMLYGHTGTVNCLDVYADRLVSGAKDCVVKVWSLQTGKQFEDLNFKHPRPIQCVKINRTTVYSGCNRGIIKVWNMETAALIRVIDAHKNSVKCLFLDEWHLLSADSKGQVTAWSTNCDVKECLMTFNHPKEVKSLTLVYLRVITGCADGRIRVLNFLTGDCLREFKAEAETGRILSLHFHDNSILVNSSTSVKRYQFAKVFWDYMESTERGREDAVAQDHTKKVASTGSKVLNFNIKKPERSELLHHTCCSSSPGKERSKSAPESVMLSEKAASERMRKRGLHHPLTRDSIHLRVNAMQRARCTDEVSVNMERNARLRDSWGPETSESQMSPPEPPQDAHLRRPKTCVPILKRAVCQSMTRPVQGRVQCHSADTRRPIRRLSLFIKSETEGPRAPEGVFTTRSLPHSERDMKTRTSLPRISPVSPVRERGGFRLISEKQMEDCVRAKRKLMKSC
ncbi:F-box/WD repeat-containing protein 10 [Labrus mixtus]|uniref:F-box/WD repeat-containing protein 10 n=1 Tax=Labrus mixtus TaxID=508554 RepID=UPI0029BFDB93|nr:F-box/WD repeat-containing protein 10 [Labrus mixtus]